jgi:hypothetical protein
MSKLQVTTRNSYCKPNYTTQTLVQQKSLIIVSHSWSSNTDSAATVERHVITGHLFWRWPLLQDLWIHETFGVYDAVTFCMSYGYTVGYCAICLQWKSQYNTYNNNIYCGLSRTVWCRKYFGSIAEISGVCHWVFPRGVDCRRRARLLWCDEDSIGGERWCTSGYATDCEVKRCPVGRGVMMCRWMRGWLWSEEASGRPRGA